METLSARCFRRLSFNEWKQFLYVGFIDGETWL